MGDASERCLDAAGNHRNIWPKFLQDFRIDDGRHIGTHAVASSRRVGVIVSEASVRRIMVHHRVHRAGRHPEEKSRSPQFLEITQVIAPIGLRHNRDLVTGILQSASDHGGPERRVVDISVTREQDYIGLVPAQCIHFIARCRQKISLQRHVHSPFQARTDSPVG